MLEKGKNIALNDRDKTLLNSLMSVTKIIIGISYTKVLINFKWCTLCYSVLDTRIVMSKL